MSDNIMQLGEIHIKLEEIPDIVASQVSEIEKLEGKVNAAMRKAEEAKQSADHAYRKSTGWFKKGEAIESLQQAAVDLAESQISASEAQKVSFEYQEKLSEITKYLFMLGVMSLAANRKVVNELQERLRGASEEKLNDLARQEIMNVIKQLKAQEDIMIKQQFLAEKVRKHEKSLLEKENKDEEQDRRIAENVVRDEEQDRLIAENAARDEEQDRRIAENAAKDEEQDRLIAENAARDEEQDRRIAEQACKDEEHDRLIAENAAKDEEQDRQIAEQALKDEEHDRLIAENAAKDMEQDELIQTLRNECMELKQKIDENKEEIQKLIYNMDDKGDKKAVVFSFVIAAAGVVISCIHILL